MYRIIFIYININIYGFIYKKMINMLLIVSFKVNSNVDMYRIIFIYININIYGFIYKKMINMLLIVSFKVNSNVDGSIQSSYSRYLVQR